MKYIVVYLFLCRNPTKIPSDTNFALQEQTAECKRLADERRAEAEGVEGLRAELQASLLERQELQERERALLCQSEERSGQLDDWRLQLSLANGELQKVGLQIMPFHVFIELRVLKV